MIKAGGVSSGSKRKILDSQSFALSTFLGLLKIHAIEVGESYQHLEKFLVYTEESLNDKSKKRLDFPRDYFIDEKQPYYKIRIAEGSPIYIIILYEILSHFQLDNSEKIQEEKKLI